MMYLNIFHLSAMTIRNLLNVRHDEGEQNHPCFVKQQPGHPSSHHVFSRATSKPKNVLGPDERVGKIIKNRWGPKDNCEKEVMNLKVRWKANTWAWFEHEFLIKKKMPQKTAACRKFEN